MFHNKQKTKKPLHTSGSRNKRGRKILSAPVFCFKPKICNGFELNQSKREKRKGFSLLSIPLTERGRDLLHQRLSFLCLMLTGLLYINKKNLSMRILSKSFKNFLCTCRQEEKVFSSECY